MVNYRKDRERINVNALGSLYIDKGLDENSRPVIYIGGQMEHRLHVIEQTGVTFDVGHKLFDGSWFYDYPTTGTKSNINTENFADNLLKSLEAADLYDVDIITESFGGLIAASASKSPRIHKVVAIHPPILGTPLASNDVVLDALSKLEKKQRIIAQIVNFVVNDRYGFQQDNAKGIINSKILDSIDFSKLTVVGSNMDRENDKSKVAKYLYDLIYALEGKESDGVVLFDEERFKSLGINYIKETSPTNHFAANSKNNIMRAAAMTLEGFDFVEDDEIRIEDDESRLIGTLDDKYDFDEDIASEEENVDDDISNIIMVDLFEDIDKAKKITNYKDEDLDHVSSRRALVLEYFKQKEEQ